MQTTEIHPASQTEQEQRTQTNQPQEKFRAGAITATIWKNSGTSKSGQPVNYFTVSLQRSYKDKEDNWKHTSSLRLNDLPKAKLVLSKAYEFLILRDKESDTQ